MTTCPHPKIPSIWQIFGNLGYYGLFQSHELQLAKWVIYVILSHTDSWWVIWHILYICRERLSFRMFTFFGGFKDRALTNLTGIKVGGWAGRASRGGRGLCRGSSVRVWTCSSLSQPPPPAARPSGTPHIPVVMTSSDTHTCDRERLVGSKFQLFKQVASEQRERMVGGKC